MFKFTKGLLTALAIPTLLMMTAAFSDYDFVMKAYQEAIKKKYKFMCYGDALLIL